MRFRLDGCKLLTKPKDKNLATNLFKREHPLKKA